MTQTEQLVRFALYNAQTGELLGYKGDSLWTAKSDVFKFHELGESGIGGEHVSNLLSVLELVGRETSLKIEAQTFEGDGVFDGVVEPYGRIAAVTSHETLATYLIKPDPESHGKFHAIDVTGRPTEDITALLE